MGFEYFCCYIESWSELIGNSELWMTQTAFTVEMKFGYMSRIMRKPDFCLGENKGADQLRNNCKADQHLCFLLHS